MAMLRSKLSAKAGWTMAGILVVVLISWLVWPRRAGASAPRQAGLSREAAAAAGSKFRQIQDSSSSGQSFGSIRISESELNSYVHYEMEPYFPPGFSKVHLQLQPSRPHGTAEVDFDKLKVSLKTPPNPFISYFLRGVHTLGVEGTLSASNGVGQFHLETVTLDDLVLPEPVVEFLVDHYLKSRYPGVAIDRSFALGFGIDKLNVESGSVLLTGRPMATSGKGLRGTLLFPLLK